MPSENFTACDCDVHLKYTKSTRSGLKRFTPHFTRSGSDKGLKSQMDDGCDMMLCPGRA